MTMLALVCLIAVITFGKVDIAEKLNFDDGLFSCSVRQPDVSITKKGHGTAQFRLGYP